MEMSYRNATDAAAFMKRECTCDCMVACIQLGHLAFVEFDIILASFESPDYSSKDVQEEVQAFTKVRSLGIIHDDIL